MDLGHPGWSKVCLGHKRPLRIQSKCASDAAGMLSQQFAGGVRETQFAACSTPSAAFSIRAATASGFDT